MVVENERNLCRWPSNQSQQVSDELHNKLSVCGLANGVEELDWPEWKGPSYCSIHCTTSSSAALVRQAYIVRIPCFAQERTPN